MHLLNRTAAMPPTCLSSFRHGTHNWDDVLPEHRQEIRSQLEHMQGRLCAYCEGPLDELDHHIEHFRRRRDHVRLTFEWTNLLLCCGCSDSCGHHKDRPGSLYNPNHLIDPTTDDPDAFFRFYENGTIRIREGLNINDQHRAAETLRVLNLDAEFGRLRQMRARQFQWYRDMNFGVFEDLMLFQPAERREYVRQELEATASQPFCTVIRHFFEGFA